MEPLRFDDRVVLVTGAGRGIGLAHARLFAERGAKVVIADAGVHLYGEPGDASIADGAAAELRDAGFQAVSYTADLSDPEAARGAVRYAVDSFGRLDALVHNAGFTLGSMPFGSESIERLDKQLAINARAGFSLAREAWPLFQGQGEGRIVFTGSTAMYGLPRSTPYSTAKAAYIGLTRALAEEGAADGIYVNLVAPAGATRMAANMPPSQFRDWFEKTMRPELVSPLVAWLCHPVCDVTGEIFVAGGGRIGRTIVTETRGHVFASPTIESLHAARGSLMSDDEPVPIPTFQASMDIAFEMLGFQSDGGPLGYSAPLVDDAAT